MWSCLTPKSTSCGSTGMTSIFTHNGFRILSNRRRNIRLCQEYPYLLFHLSHQNCLKFINPCMNMITWSTRPKSCYPPFRTNIVLVILSLRSNIEHSWAFNPLLLTFFQTYYSTTAVGMTIHQTSCELVFKKKNITLFDSPIQLNFLYIHYSIFINTNIGNYIHNLFLSHVLPNSISLT